MTNTSNWWRRSALGAMAVLAAASMIAGACGDDDDDDGDATATRGATTAAGSPTRGATSAATSGATAQATQGATGTAAAGAGTVEIGDTALGQVLTDGDGLTLYVFANDVAGSGTSACTGGCANVWPPLAVSGAVTAPAGATGTFTTITRDDGSMQAAYNGKPLYRFVNDTAPGQTNGEGVANLWTVAKP